MKSRCSLGIGYGYEAERPILYLEYLAQCVSPELPISQFFDELIVFHCN